VKEEKQNDASIIIVETLQKADFIRREIINQFPDVWIYVSKDERTSGFEITAANSFGSKLGQNKVELLKSFSLNAEREFEN